MAAPTGTGKTRRRTFAFKNRAAMLALALALLPPSALAQVEIPAPPQAQAFAQEDHDWGVAPTSTPQGPPFGRPTPTSIPGARRIGTLELKALLEANRQVVVIDVLDSRTRTTVPGAYWIAGAGDSRYFAAEKNRFPAALEKVVGGDKSRPVVFLCVSSQCWESYNACLHAVEAGYKDVLWYRGGTSAWSAAGLKRAVPERVDW
jgi:PQQ-dependent catabolism-associated CXXCW motif protein